MSRVILPEDLRFLNFFHVDNNRIDTYVLLIL